MAMIHIESLIFHYPSGEFRLEIPAFTVARGERTALKKKLMFDQKKLIVMQNMEFTADEGKFFWPVCDELQKELLCFKK